MNPRFEALFTDNPSPEAVTQLLDCLQALAAACDSQDLSALQRRDQEQRNFHDSVLAAVGNRANMVFRARFCRRLDVGFGVEAARVVSGMQAGRCVAVRTASRAGQ